MRRILPAIGLFFLSPLIAEYLLGDLPVTALFALVVLAPMYGGASLLIREVCRRLGWGWPSMLTLALAYSVLEEAIVTQSLFDHDYGGMHLHLLDRGYVPALGIGLPYTLFVLALHVVWSLSVPIVLTESIVRERHDTPWLGRIGVAVTAIVCAVGVALNVLGSRKPGGFAASPAQLVVSALVVVALAGAAVLLGRRTERARSAGVVARTAGGLVPPPLLLGLGSLVLASAFVTGWYHGRPAIQPWVFAAVVLVAYVATVVLVATWSRRPGWTPMHQLALAGGALLTYAWHGFETRPFVPTPPSVQLASHVVMGVFAVAVLTVAVLRLRAGEPRRTRPTESAPAAPAAHPAG
ncbi:hypothetical protein ABZV93_03875 [Actinopolymorpha sp. NPDC004070]|uniref:hypothetical protein n=1 Tax=Actinopolymorpha sp. NPDC004070 TaxID=3154548 RepID=UPI0033B7EC68